MQNGKMGYLDPNGNFKGFSGGAIYLGEYSANTTIDVSALGATSADQFLFVDGSKNTSGSNTGYFYEREYGAVRGNASITPPTATLTNGTLNLTVGVLHMDATAYTTYYSSWEARCSTSQNVAIPCKVYYVGDIESIS